MSRAGAQGLISGFRTCRHYVRRAVYCVNTCFRGIGDAQSLSETCLSGVLLAAALGAPASVGGQVTYVDQGLVTRPSTPLKR